MERCAWIHRVAFNEFSTVVLWSMSILDRRFFWWVTVIQREGLLGKLVSHLVILSTWVSSCWSGDFGVCGSCSWHTGKDYDGCSSMILCCWLHLQFGHASFSVLFLAKKFMVTDNFGDVLIVLLLCMNHFTLIGILCFHPVEKIIVFWKVWYLLSFHFDGCSGLSVSFAFEILQLENIYCRGLLSKGKDFGYSVWWKYGCAWFLPWWYILIFEYQSVILLWNDLCFVGYTLDILMIFEILSAYLEEGLNYQTLRWFSWVIVDITLLRIDDLHVWVMLFRLHQMISVF